jgi:hypothetical protein
LKLQSLFRLPVVSGSFILMETHSVGENGDPALLYR